VHIGSPGRRRARKPEGRAARPSERRPLPSEASAAKASPKGAQRGAAERKPKVRLGLRYAAGLRAEVGASLVAARRCAPLRSVADLCARVALRRDELDALAELGALASIDPSAKSRRAALWQVAALERDPRSLFAGVSPGTPARRCRRCRPSSRRSPTIAAAASPPDRT